jgi:hypothetical protein
MGGDPRDKSFSVSDHEWPSKRGHIRAAGAFLLVACLNAVCIVKTPCPNDFRFLRELL